jgi:acyl-CoA hydrolase
MEDNPRPRKHSVVITRTELVLPFMTNVHGTMFGGRVLEMMDMTCGIAAMRFCRKPVVTISSEHVDFKVPIRAGSIIEMKAKVVYTGTTSMTIKVTVHSQHPAEDASRLCTTGFFNFVALDRTGRTTVQVPELIVESEEDREDWEHARKLREFRKKQ